LETFFPKKHTTQPVQAQVYMFALVTCIIFNHYIVNQKPHEEKTSMQMITIVSLTSISSQFLNTCGGLIVEQTHEFKMKSLGNWIKMDDKVPLNYIWLWNNDEKLIHIHHISMNHHMKTIEFSY
jgi:hypothetical protein